MSLDLNIQNNLGDTALHVGFRHEMDLNITGRLLKLGANVHLRNLKGRPPLHDAVRYSSLGIPAVDLLLRHGASLNAIDDQGATVLHDALKNPLVALTTVKKLLEYGAPPDYRDEKKCPPLAYCESSSLRPAEKESAAKLLIQYTVLQELDDVKQLEKGSSLVEGDEILCLHFCKDATKRNKWATFRDSCIAEIMSMAKLSVGNNCLLKLVTNPCCCKQTNEAIDTLALEKILSVLHRNEYPVYRDFITSTIEECNFDALVEKLEVYTIKPTSPGKVGNTLISLNFACIIKIVEYLPKVDLINFILAYLYHRKSRNVFHYSKRKGEETEDMTVRKKISSNEEKSEGFYL